MLCVSEVLEFYNSALRSGTWVNMIKHWQKISKIPDYELIL